MAVKLMTGEDLERGERLIRVLFETGDWPDSALRHMSINKDGFARFIAHQVSTLRAMYPDIDPRHEAAIATMFTHLFLTAVAASRGVGYSEDEGVSGRV